MPIPRFNSVLRTHRFASTPSIALRARTQPTQLTHLPQTHARTMSATRPEKKQRTEDYILYYVRIRRP